MPVVWFWMAVAALAVLAAVCSSDVVVRVRYRRVGADDEAELEIRALFGLIRRRSVVKAFDWSWAETEFLVKRGQEDVTHIDREDVERFIRNTRLALRLTFHLTGVVRRLTARMRLTELEWHTVIGVRDAFWTAMLTGAAWSIQTGVTGALSRRLRLCARPALRVEPLFGSSVFKTKLAFTARIRAGFLLLAGLTMIGRILRVKGGFEGWVKLLTKEKAETQRT
jgi:Protein of unknown function (DUF2953).